MQPGTQPDRKSQLTLQDLFLTPGSRLVIFICLFSLPRIVRISRTPVFHTRLRATLCPTKWNVYHPLFESSASAMRLYYFFLFFSSKISSAACYFSGVIETSAYGLSLR